MKQFPIIAPIFRRDQEQVRRAGVTIPDSIPWDMLETHARQAEKNHYQTLAQLAERGGLSAQEALAVLEDRRWHAMDNIIAHRELNAAVKTWLAAHALEQSPAAKEVSK